MNDYGIGKSLYITSGEDYTHAIILNTAMPLLKIPKDNVIGLAFEPPAFLRLSQEFINYAEKYIGKYFIGDRIFWLDKKIQLPGLFIEHYAYMWHSSPLNYIPVKNNLMSIMVSNKNFSPGHTYRHTLVKHILRSGYPIDIYGNGANIYEATSHEATSHESSSYGPTSYGPTSYGPIKMYHKCQDLHVDSRIKGKFANLEPYENYQFHICIENYQTNAYFSEKISNALLCGTTPIYLGCNKILEMFPNNVIILTGNIVKDMTLLRDIILNPRKYMANINVESVKDKLNLLKNLDKCF
jgi:hypothetical protein